MTHITDRPASVVVVGYGLAGRVFHAPLVDTTPGLLLDAIVTSDPERQGAAADAYPNAVIYDNPEQAWASGHDLAVVATPNITHVPFARAALENHLNVVLDKPIAPTAEAAQELATMASDRGLLLVPFQNRRWDSDFLTAMAIAADDSIGRVHRYESRIERMRIVPKPGWRGSTDPAEMGGMLYDLGAHIVDQALRLMGPVETVYATARTVRDGQGSDDDVTVILTHSGGGISQLVASQIGAFAEPRISVYGTRGGLRITSSDSQEPALAEGRLPIDDTWGLEPAGTEAALRIYSPDNELTETALPLLRGDWPAFYRGVSAALRGEAAAPVLVEDVVADLRVIDAARESARTGSAIRLNPPAGHR
ncbi:MAG: Gfo/Idh/MocA family oxidoreductase [Actinomycetes bacterium]